MGVFGLVWWVVIDWSLFRSCCCVYDFVFNVKFFFLGLIFWGFVVFFVNCFCIIEEVKVWNCFMNDLALVLGGFFFFLFFVMREVSEVLIISLISCFYDLLIYFWDVVEDVSKDRFKVSDILILLSLDLDSDCWEIFGFEGCFFV